MRATYVVQDQNANLKVSVVPDYGGMISSIKYKDLEILYLDEGMVETSPINAGGIPVLFPFPGKVKDDTFQVDGKTYFMPMHGLVKNSSFVVEKAASEEVVLCIDGSRACKERNYPFEYLLRITYRVKGDSLFICTEITNRSEKKMPHCLGWHPYFRTSDRAKLVFEHSMAIHYDCANEIEENAQKELNLANNWNDVFFQPQNTEFKLRNEADGYEVKCITSPEYQTYVIYTGRSGSTCIEPWCGIPNSINLNRMVEWLAPGETKKYEIELQISQIQCGNGEAYDR